jgi:hypothetical protein
MFDQNDDLSVKHIADLIVRLKKKAEPMENAMFRPKIKIKEIQIEEFKKSIQRIQGYLESLASAKLNELQKIIGTPADRLIHGCILATLWSEARVTGRWLIAGQALQEVDIKELRDHSSPENKERIDMIVDTINTLKNNTFSISTQEIDTLISKHPNFKQIFLQIKKKTKKYEKISSGKGMNLSRSLGPVILIGFLIIFPFFSLHLFYNDILFKKIIPDPLEKHFRSLMNKIDQEKFVTKLGPLEVYIRGVKPLNLEELRNPKIHIQTPKIETKQFNINNDTYNIPPEIFEEINNEYTLINNQSRILVKTKTVFENKVHEMKTIFETDKYSEQEKQLIINEFKKRQNSYFNDFKKWEKENETFLHKIEKWKHS